MIYYPKSFLASVVSIFSCAMMLVAVMGAFQDGEMETLILIPVGIAGLVLARVIADNKAFKLWVKEIKKTIDLDRIIAGSMNEACSFYDKANNKKAALKYIQNLNPAAADHIRRVTGKK